MTIRRRIKDERGVVVVVAMLVLVVALLLSAAVVAATLHESSGSRRDVTEKRAFEYAQAGLQQTLYRFNMLLNTSLSPGQDPSTLNSSCMGDNGSGTEVIEAPSINGAVCRPHTESLGNGAFYTSWTSTAPSTSATTVSCAGVSISTTAYVGERCITSEGIVCPASYIIASQLPCPGEVVHRVEERISANLGAQTFPNPGIIGTDGVDIRNAATINGPVSTNDELSIDTNGHILGSPQQLGPTGRWPLLNQSNSQLNTCYGASYPPGTTTWPSSCVNRVSTLILALQPFPPTNCTGVATDNTCSGSGPWSYQQPDGDRYISNAFLPCATDNSCAHDTLPSTCTMATSASDTSACWNPWTRTLVLTKGTWVLYGGSYDFCSLQLSGAKTTAQLGLRNRAAIWIDSPSDPGIGTPPAQTGPKCPAGTGSFSASQGASFINNFPGSTPGIQYDTTALQIYVYGTDPSPTWNPTYNNNDCTLGNASCIQLGQTADFYGTVDAPYSDIQIANSGATYGSIEGRTVTYLNNTVFTTDQADSSIKSSALGIYYRTQWHDCAVQPTNPSDPTSGC